MANVVLVKKSNSKWRMCVDYTDLNKVCPKDTCPLLSIDWLVDNTSGYEMLIFLDAYSGHNQIRMYLRRGKDGIYDRKVKLLLSSDVVWT